jgi:tetratricopeptide (TPR) repeat protein
MSAPRSESSGLASRSSWKGVLAAPNQYQLYARKAGLHRVAGENLASDSALRWARVLRPDEPRLLVNAANLWLATGLPGDPIRALRRALCVEPGFIAAADRLVLLNKALGDRRAAARGARRGICRGAGARTGPLLELILLLSDDGDRSEAIALMGLALAEMIGSPADLRALFRAAKRMGGSKLLVRAVQSTLCDTPVHAVAARELASTPVQDDSEWPTRAILSRLRYALPLDPVISNGAGVYLENQGRADEALSHYVKALMLDPALSISLFNMGVQARYAGDFSRAAGLFERALMIGPNDPIYQYNLGHVLLATGHSRRGLELYESRWGSGERQSHRRGGPTPSFQQPMLEELDADAGDAEASLLIWGEQGLGDEIWFAGYAPRLVAGRQKGQQKGQRTVLECDWRLTGLFNRSGLAGNVVTRMDPPHPDTRRAALQVAAGSLPFLTERALG